MELILRIDELREEHRASVGAKAHSLAVLAGAGFAVPEGFVLGAEALRRFAAQPALETELRSVAALVGEGALAPHRSAQFLVDARAKLEAAPLPHELRVPLMAAYRRVLGDGVPVAVRSSGTKEDLADASFAGQYETFLDVRGAEALEAAVKRCWASTLRNRVLHYAAHKASGSSDLGMAVVVQRLVPAEVSGVLFTVNPVSGREGEVLVEAVRGLGEALVSGKVTPDRYVLEAASGAVLSQQIPPEPPGEQGGKPRERAPALEAPCLAELAAIAGKVQRLYGRPMDVEWVLAEGRIWLVQARPITRLNFAEDIGEWTTADFRDGGVSAEVCTPFLWSLYERVLEHSLPAYFREIKLLPKETPGTPAIDWGRMFFGRPYWNLGAVKGVLERIPGFVERNFDLDLGVTPSYEGPGRTTPMSVGKALGALPVLFALRRAYRERLEDDRRFHDGFAAACKPWELDPAALAAMPAADFVLHYGVLLRGFYFETETRYFFTIYNTSNSKLDFKGAFEAAAKAIADRGQGEGLSYLDLVGGLQDLSHLRPMKDLHALCGRLRAEGRGPDEAELSGFAARWGHHGRKELDLRVPRWRDDPEFVRGLIARALEAWSADRDPSRQEAAQHARYLAERRRAVEAMRGRPFKRRSFEKGLDLVRTYAWWREEMRDHSTYVYALVRDWTLEAGRRLAASGLLGVAEDVWLLRFEDVLAGLEGSAGAERLRPRAEQGRGALEGFRNFPNPNEIGGRHRYGSPHAFSGSSSLLRGTPCSPGQVEGRVKVVRRLEDATKVGQGDILVAVFTDPGWTPLLGLVKAVVTETGGLLSHAAVISREYGIPAVLAVPEATSRLRDGDHVRIDGSAGTVEVLLG